MIHDSDPQTQLLGEIKGIVEGLRDSQDEQNKRLDRFEDRIDGRMDQLDDRLRTQEIRSASYGAVSGGVMGVGMALLVEGLKVWLKRGGTGL